MAPQMARRLVEIAGDGKAETLQRLARPHAPRGVAVEAVHEDAPAAAREQQRGEQEPRQLPLLAGIGRPIEIDARRVGRNFEGSARGANEAGDLLARLFLHPQQHQERADLFGPGLPRQDHAHRLFRFLDRQGTGQGLAASENVDEAGEGMRSLKHGEKSSGRADRRRPQSWWRANGPAAKRRLLAQPAEEEKRRAVPAVRQAGDPAAIGC